MLRMFLKDVFHQAVLFFGLHGLRCILSMRKSETMKGSNLLYGILLLLITYFIGFVSSINIGNVFGYPLNIPNPFYTWSRTHSAGNRRSLHSGSARRGRRHLLDTSVNAYLDSDYFYGCRLAFILHSYKRQDYQRTNFKEISVAATVDTGSVSIRLRGGYR